MALAGLSLFCIMKSAVKLLITSLVCAQDVGLEGSKPALFGQYAKAITEVAFCVQLNDSSLSDHSGFGFVAVQLDVYSQSIETRAEWEGLMSSCVNIEHYM